MARLKGAAQADSLAAEAWAAGCREVQSAINWASAKGEVSGAKFQAAFRKVVAAQESTPPPVAAPTMLPTKSGADLGGGPGKRSRKGRSVQAETGTQTNGSRSSGTRRTKPEDDIRDVGEPAPRVAKVAVVANDPKSATPADFVEDMRRLRHLVTKYGRKGLADLIGMLSD